MLTDVLKMATVETLMDRMSVAVTLATVSTVMVSHVMVLSKTVFFKRVIVISHYYTQ